MISYTQEELTNLATRFSCCLAKKAAAYANKLRYALTEDCGCEFCNLKTLQWYIEMIKCYKLGQTIIHKPAIAAAPTTWSRGLFITPGDTVTVFGLVDGISTELGSGTTIELLCTDINANTGTTGWAATWNGGTPLFYLITSPDGLYAEDTLIEVAEPSGVPVPGTATTYVAGREAEAAQEVTYEADELNCISEQNLNDIIEWCKRFCTCNCGESQPLPVSESVWPSNATSLCITTTEEGEGPVTSTATAILEFYTYTYDGDTYTISFNSVENRWEIYQGETLIAIKNGTSNVGNWIEQVGVTFTITSALGACA